MTRPRCSDRLLWVRGVPRRVCCDEHYWQPAEMRTGLVAVK